MERYIIGFGGITVLFLVCAVIAYVKERKFHKKAIGLIIRNMGKEISREAEKAMAQSDKYCWLVCGAIFMTGVTMVGGIIRIYFLLLK